MNPTSILADSTLGQGAVDPAEVIGETGRGRGGRKAVAGGGEGVEEGEEASGRSTALKRSTLTDAQKYEICVYLKETDDGGEEKLTHRAVTNYILHRYNVKVDTSTISRLRKTADKRLSHESPNPFSKRHRAVTFPELERRLTHYIESNRGETRITDSMIVGKAKELRDELTIAPELLSFSAGWLSKFKIRNGLKIRLSDTPQPQQAAHPYRQQQHQHSLLDVDNNDTEELAAVLPTPPRPMVISHGSSPGSTRLRTKPTPISSSNTSTEQGAPSKRRNRARRGVNKDTITISPRPSPSAASPLQHSPSPLPPSPPVQSMVESNTMDQYGSQSDISDMDMDLDREPGMEDDAENNFPTDHLKPTLPTLDYSSNNYNNDIRNENPAVSVSEQPLPSTSDRQPRSNSRTPIPHRSINNNDSSNPAPSNVVRKGPQSRSQALLSKMARIDAELSLSPSSILEAASVNSTPIPSASNTTPPLPYTIPLGSTRREPSLRSAAVAAVAAAPMTPFVGQYVPPCSLYIPTARPMSALPSMISSTVTSAILPLPFTVPTMASTATEATKAATLSATHSTTHLPFAATTTPPTTSTSALSSTTSDRSHIRDVPVEAMDDEDKEEEEDDEGEEEEPRVDFKEAVNCINTLRIFMEQQSFEVEQVHHLQQIYLAMKRKRKSSKPSGS